jgi:hypothetical protein
MNHSKVYSSDISSHPASLEQFDPTLVREKINTADPRSLALTATGIFWWAAGANVSLITR